MIKPVLFTTLQDSNFYGSDGDNLDSQGTPIFLINLRKIINELSQYFSIGLVCSKKSFELIDSHPIIQEVDFTILRNSDSLFLTCMQVVERSCENSDFFVWFNSRNLVINPSLIRESYFGFIESQLPCMLSVTNESLLCLDKDYFNFLGSGDISTKFIFEREMIKPLPKYNKMMFGFKKDCSLFAPNSFKIDQCYLCNVPAPLFPEDLPQNMSANVISDLILKGIC